MTQYAIRAQNVTKLDEIANSSKWKIYTLPQPTVDPFVMFNDGKRQAYFILVYDMKDLDNTDKKKYFDTYMMELVQHGLEFETSSSSYFEDLVFIKVHASKETVTIFADTYDIPLAFRTSVNQYKPKVFCRFMGNELTILKKNKKLYKRAPNAIPGRKPTGVTSSEAILIIYKILEYAEFDPKSQNRGIEKLIYSHVFKDAFPLHDGFPNWPKSGPVTDRQLLGRFWASMKAWYKIQPLSQIEKYYGTETAFYFAWLGFYTTMLTIPAMFGSLMFLAGYILNFLTTSNRIKEVCESNVILCPMCHPLHCKYVYYRSYCFSAKMSYLFDNIFTVIFAIIMSIWATVFLELWKRKEAVLRVRWNITSEVDTARRYEFEKNTKHRKISTLTGQLIPYVPTSIIIFKYSVSFVTILLMMLCVVAAVFCIILYKIALKLSIVKHGEGILKKNSDMVTSATSAAILSVFIIIFGKIYNKVALCLTHFENHRTQSEFDNAFIYKCYALSFVNNYGILFYTAFLKGKFYTFPADKLLLKSKINMYTDYCNPNGCIVDVSFYLFFIMVFKGIICNIVEIVKPIVAKAFKKKKKKHQMTQWEDDYSLQAINRHYLIADYMEIVIQYGLVTFFVAVFPLAPLLAVINNVFEIRTDAKKFIRWYRRPIPRKVAGLSAWYGILQAATYMSVITNAFVIAFTSQFIPIQIYIYTKNKYLKGYINSTLSVFDTSDYSSHYPISKINVSSCHYIGKRYPPDHPNRYQLTYDYYYELVIRLFFVIIFEHVILTFNGLLAYAIPDIPFSVKEKINFEKAKVREAKLKSAHEEYLRKIGESKMNIHME